jgi:anaerobic selenocysteine-containing dehydrogenase
VSLIVIDPFRTSAAEIADLWLQPNPGTDAAIAMATMQQMIAAGRHDADFVQQWCTGFDALAERVAPFTPEHAASLTDVSAADIADVIAKVREVLPESHRRHIGAIALWAPPGHHAGLSARPHVRSHHSR